MAVCQVSRHLYSPTAKPYGARMVIIHMSFQYELNMIHMCNIHEHLPCRINIQGAPKTGLFLRVDNFARVSGRKACDM